VTEPRHQKVSNPAAPWWIVEAVDKKQARLNCIQPLASMILYEGVYHDEVGFAAAHPQPGLHTGPENGH
jgi:Polyphosphate kinase 2 (PPK2)